MKRKCSDQLLSCQTHCFQQKKIFQKMTFDFQLHILFSLLLLLHWSPLVRSVASNLTWVENRMRELNHSVALFPYTPHLLDLPPHTRLSELPTPLKWELDDGSLCNFFFPFFFLCNKRLLTKKKKKKKTKKNKKIRQLCIIFGRNVEQLNNITNLNWHGNDMLICMCVSMRPAICGICSP
jgi:hypothetical protein